MITEEINNKIGAMHFRFLDDEESYATLIQHLIDYYDLYEHFGQAVTTALVDGLENIERYIKLENALSPRSIIIEKQEVNSRDTEGAYHVVFVMDDESRYVVHFNRKQDQLLYILILLCSLKNGLLSDFFRYEARITTPVQETISRLVTMVYPYMKEKSVKQMVKDLSPDNSFTGIVQNMKGPIDGCLHKLGLSDDLYWFMPSVTNLKRKRLYRMHIPQTSIICPEEFQPIVAALPDAADYLKKDGIDINSIGRDMKNDFAKYKKLADQGDAEGLFYVGAYYGTGDVVALDYELSRQYFEKADQLGYSDATYQLGVYYLDGFGVKADTKKALKYLERAAHNGHVDAAALAAQLYERGTHGVKVNHKKAFNLYMIAAKQGNEEAIWYVLYGYLIGNGTRKDQGKAFEWLSIAENLGYYNVVVLTGGYFFDQGDNASLDIALKMFTKGVEQGNPLAFFYMGKMTLKRYHGERYQEEVALEWFVKGADCGDRLCIDIIKKYSPTIYKQHEEDWEEAVSMQDALIKAVQEMGHNEYRELFIRLVDAYRERWQESYLKEICKQLNIHKKPDGNAHEWTPERRITVRESEGGKLPYEMVLTLANGDEVIIDKINPNSLTLLLLTIICSYKSGYTTMMADDSTCRPLLKRLAQLVNGRQSR